MPFDVTVPVGSMVKYLYSSTIKQKVLRRSFFVTRSKRMSKEEGQVNDGFYFGRKNTKWLNFRTLQIFTRSCACSCICMYSYIPVRAASSH